MKGYLSMNTVMDAEQITSYPTEWDSLDLSGTPQHKLQLKLNVPVMLMQNLVAPRQCHGTRFWITKFMQNIIGVPVTILTGAMKGESVIIPEIELFPMIYRYNSNEFNFQSNSVLLLG
ncbi:ATP-dependent DNA helicase [Trichonephila clavipes]|nr:ATP-dependent DNA helicase [Trichonephila clavipes]